MIKWIACLLLGHELTEEYKISYVNWYSLDNHQEAKFYYCSRCKQYKRKK